MKKCIQCKEKPIREYSQFCSHNCKLEWLKEAEKEGGKEDNNQFR